MSARDMLRAAALLAAPLALYVWLARRVWWVCDDAFISFRYARNWANGFGLRFNPSDPEPVEGFSNFAWMALAALCERAGADPAVLMPWISFACGLALIACVHRAARAHLELGDAGTLAATGVLAGSPAIAVWATSGLETMPVALLTFVAFERALWGRGRRSAWQLAAAGALLMLVRVDGVALLLGAVAFAATGAWLGGRLAQRVRELSLPLAACALVAGFFVLWRLATFGALLPNTALAKVSPSLELWARGWLYLLSYLATTLVPLSYAVCVWLAWRSSGARWLPLLGMAALAPLLATLVGGDFMAMGRLLVPGIAFGALLVGMGVDALCQLAPARRWAVRAGALAVVAVGILPSFDLHLVPESVRSQLHFRRAAPRFRSEVEVWRTAVANAQTWRRIGVALRRESAPDASFAEVAIGARGYFSDRTLFDRAGLTAPEIARLAPLASPLESTPGHDRKRPPWFFLEREPDALFTDWVAGPRYRERAFAKVMRWDVPPEVRALYVPELRAALAGSAGPGPAYLLWLRRARPGEDAARTWRDFARELAGRVDR